MKKGLIKIAARRFALNDADKEFFEASWDLFSSVADVTSAEGKKRKEHHETIVVNHAFSYLKRAMKGNPTKKRGHRYVIRRPLAGRYVVFSDHHVTYDGHRHNFFAERGNLATYVEALDKYYDAGFTVVENGDVEDLVLYDPANEGSECFDRRNVRVQELNSMRRTKRFEQLEKILTSPSNQPWIQVLQKFDADKRLIRVAGNHDYDLQRPKYFQRLKKVYPNLRKPADYLFLEDDKRVRYAIMHGHQFDKNTAPGVAGKYGETITECLGIWFQGPDRKWSEQAPPDGPFDWGTGQKSFLNNLVVDDFDTKDGWAGIFQEVFQRNIAWNYFEKGPIDAIVDEVMTGTRFFKFRHLDEENLRAKMIQHFPSAKNRPVLVLGHSHEPRVNARSKKTGKLFRHYLNTASAGLFENLVWGIEIVDGDATLVSWRRTAPGKIVRRSWSSRNDGKRGWLDANAPAIVPPQHAQQTDASPLAGEPPSVPATPVQVVNRTTMLQLIADDPAAGVGSGPDLLMRCLIKNVKPSAVGAITAPMVARLCPKLPQERIYDSLLYLAALRLFDVAFWTRDERGGRVEIPTASVRAQLADDVPLEHPLTGARIKMRDVEVAFRGTGLMRGMLG